MTSFDDTILFNVAHFDYLFNFPILGDGVLYALCAVCGAYLEIATTTSVAGRKPPLWWWKNTEIPHVCCSFRLSLELQILFHVRACIIHIVDFRIPYLTRAGKGMNLICVYIKRNATETVSQSIN